MQFLEKMAAAGCFQTIAHDLRLLLRLAAQREGTTCGVILNSCTVQSTPQSGTCAGFDGHKKLRVSMKEFVCLTASKFASSGVLKEECRSNTGVSDG